MKKFKIFARAVCLLLCVVMVAQLPPISVFADDRVSTSIGTSVPSGSLSDTSTLIPITGEAYEIVEMRTPTEKFLRLEDGSYMAAKYAYDVHYLDGDKYEEYDNTMVSKTVGGKTSFVPQKSDVNISFSTSTQDSSLFSVGKDDFNIAVSVYTNSGFEIMSNTAAVEKVETQLADVSAIVENNSELTVSEKTVSASKVDDITSLTTLSSKVTYRNVFPKTAFEYTVFGKNIKEKIILQSADAGNRWQFKLAVSGVNATVETDGSIAFRDKETNEIKCTIPKGYMYDNSGKFSNDVVYTIHETSGGYILTVTADKTWIEDADRIFPVTVDPTFIIGGYTSTDVSDTYVVEGSPTRVSGVGYEGMIAGYDPNSIDLRQRILVKINELPEIPKSATVVSAKLLLHQHATGSWLGYQGTADYMDLVAKKITGSWSETTTCWNNQPTFSEDILDYITVTSGTGAEIFSLDVTSAVQDWYETPSTNHGVIIQSTTENVNCHAGFVTSENPYFATAQKPIYTVSYRDTRGLDDRWAYSTQNAGIAGTGHVNLFNGNLVFVHDDISTAGSIIPITVSHVFNGYQAGLQFSANSSNINAPVTANYTMNVGYGWKLSVCESVVEKTISGEKWLVYNDADGTELHFHDYDDGTSGNYQSEDGYAITITTNSSSTTARYVMKDDYDNIKRFNSSGFITSIEDRHGNKKNFTYSSGKLTYITYQPAGTTTSINQLHFVYNSAGALNKIENCLDTTKYVEYYYSANRTGSYTTEKSGYLRKIAYSSGDSIVYAYDVNSYLITGRDPSSTSYTQYMWNKQRIALIQEWTGATITKKHVRFSYADKKTIVRNAGSDDISDNADDINTTYLFDDYGRTVCTYVTDLEGNELYGASNAVYNKNDNETNPRKNNTLEKASSSGYYPNNLAVNGSFETTGSWTLLPGNAGSVEYTSEESFLGNKSLKVTSGSLTSGVTCYQSMIIATTGTYTFSVYVKTQDLITSDEDNSGVYIALFTTSGDVIKTNTCESIQNGWLRLSVSHTFANIGSAMAFLHFSSATGTAYFDCVQFEKADGPSNYNLVTNGVVSNNGTWNYSTNASYDSTSGINSTGSIKIVGNIQPASKEVDDSYAKQTSLVNKPASSTSFMLSGWAKGNSVALEDGDTFTGNEGSANGTRYFALKAVINYSDGTSETKYVDFNPNIRGEWQYASGIVMPSQSNFSKTISTVDVWAYYRYNANTAYFDNIALTIEPAQTYTYDSKGQLVGVSSADGNNETLVYEDTRLMSQEAATGEKYTYTYVEKSDGTKTHDVKDVTSKAGVKVSYNYDTYGNVGSVQIHPTSCSLVISSSSIYSYYGNFVSFVYDERGNSTGYNYNHATGLLNYITNANNCRTSYIYDAAGRMTDLFEDVDKDGVFDSSEIGVSYVYNSQKQLQQIVTASTVYNFAYDGFGNCISITIGDNETPLATYTYAVNNGKLMSTTYADGTVVSNTYDELDRIESVSYNGVVAYTVYYNGNGSVSMYDEVSTGRKHHYEYDSIGRLIRYRIQEGNTTLLSTENVYDNTGRLSSFKYAADGQPAKSEIYTYDTYGRLSSVNANGTTIAVSYDEFERINSKTYTKNVNSTDISHSESYSFYTKDSNTTTLVNGITAKHGYETIQYYDYVYDKVGNIQSVTSNTESYYYQYDDDILMTEDIENFITDETIAYIYSYDNAGNILKKSQVDMETYAWVPIKTYTYGNSEWGDLLTAVNGQTITYDANGNPLNYYNGEHYTFTWQNGRRLASTVKGDTNVTYTYDSEGLRIAKTVNNSLHTYIYYDNILLQERWGNCYIEYLYDESGSPMGINYYDGTTLHEYYFVKNLQGDVTAIRDWNGNLVATYIYDAWGNILSLTDGTGTPITSTTHIGYINPIRYRGYYYDVETGFYYLQSRYYDAKICRFISADGYVSTGQGILGNNMFAYCNNNPVYYIDLTGDCPHNSRFYTSGPFKGQFEYDPFCWKCAAHGEFWIRDIYGNYYDFTQFDMHEYEQMAICTDGSTEKYNSNSHQDMTSYSIGDEYMNPSIIRYVVAPVGYSGVKDGDLAMVIDRSTGETVFAVVGDRGPVGYHNEVSLKVAWDLGYEWADGSRGPKGSFVTLYFPSINGSWSSVTELRKYLDNTSITMRF